MQRRVSDTIRTHAVTLACCQGAPAGPVSGLSVWLDVEAHRWNNAINCLYGTCYYRVVGGQPRSRAGLL